MAYEQFLCLLDQARQSEEKKGGEISSKKTMNLYETLWKMVHCLIEISGSKHLIDHLIVNGKILISTKFFFNLIFSHSILHFENIIKSGEGKKLIPFHMV